MIVQSVDGEKCLKMPTVIECENIPGNKLEIPTPETASKFPHLKSIANKIPKLQPDTPILILLGRDIPQAHKIRELRNGPNSAPWGQRLDLGWVVVGNMCLGGAHQKEDITSCRTQVLLNGRPSVTFDACQNAIKVSNLGDDIFKREADDDRIGMSIEDNEFLDLMNHEMEKDKGGNWEAPLPFRSNRSVLPNNKRQAESRMKSLIRTLEKKPIMKTHYIEFMAKILQKGHAERVDESQNSDKEYWYLPHFGVYHSQKPDKIRVVFDSSAEFQGISLNSVLLSGPDLVNQLLGVLIRFRENPVAVMADVEQMFYAFKVKEQHRDYLRFLWFEDNDPDANLVTYRMKVHIFGNRPSPGVATLGLRRTAKEGESEFGSDARAFVESNFYVDDGLKSFASAREAVDLLTRTRNMLATANIKLHKIASNDKEVMAAFAPKDLAPNVQEVDLGSDAPVMQRSLGVYWDMRSDTFTYKILQANGEPSTKRAVLSEINSVYDPLGFAAPVIIEGKMLLREIIGENKVGWDELLPQQPLEAWKKWRSSINELSQVNVPRAYTQFPAKEAVRRELHIFGDASSRAISAVSYLRSVNKSGKAYASFVLGKSKLAPKAATTIPRMELCAAVLGTEVSELAVTELDLKIDAVYFYTDSKVVMGYITNRTHRFYLYVSNRVARILRVSKPEYWKYIPTAMKPADVGSRSIKAKDLQNSPWLQGPTFLPKSSLPPSLETDERNYDDDLDNDPEVRNTVSAYATEVKMTGVLESHRFNRFSSWLKLLRAIASLILLANKSKRKANVISDKERYALAANIFIRTVQHEAFEDEISSLKAEKNLSSSSSLVKLNPVLDSEGLLRIGGRVTAALDLTFTEKHPLIIPKKSHLTSLLVTHYHQEVVHQGRHLTEGAVRSAGYWIIGSKQVVSRLIYSCVTCRKLRGKFQVQKMADLPTERLAQDPPFTYVGLDVWGPWSVVARRTRGGLAQSKRWAVLFTCMCSMAVHIEFIEPMDASSLINALRRFLAIRGPIKQLRSDCGTNFIGACSELQASLQESGLSKVKKYLLDKNCEWIFNPPHSSHMGGVWERMIGVARRILEGMFKTLGVTKLTHEVLVTLMAEVSSIINARPLVPVSSDPEVPTVLSPNMLLTQKTSTFVAPKGKCSKTDLHGRQWRQVQHLADMFWYRWRKEYIPTIQNRTKWQKDKRNMKVGDIVIMRDAEATRNDWPSGRVVATEAGSDGRVRKVEVTITRGDDQKALARPIAEVILILPVGDEVDD